MCREAFSKPSNCKWSKSASDRFLTLVLQLAPWDLLLTTCQSQYVLHSRNHIISGKQASRNLLACLLASLVFIIVSSDDLNDSILPGRWGGVRNGLDWSGGDLDPFHGFIFVCLHSSPPVPIHPAEIIIIIILSSSTSSPFLFHFLLALSSLTPPWASLAAHYQRSNSSFSLHCY